MNFALALASNRVPGVSVNFAQDVNQGAEENESRLEQNLLEGRVTEQTHAAVLKQMESPQATAVTAAAFTKVRADKRGDLFAPPPQLGAQLNRSALAVALLLGSPDFQRR
jgi:hypothetical protein